MKFFAPTEEPVHIGLTSGHTAVVTHEGDELDPMFHREAVARGCMPEGVGQARPVEAEHTFDRASAIKDAVLAMKKEAIPSDFKQDGTPDVRMVSKRVGFQANRDEVAAAWGSLTEAQG